MRLQPSLGKRLRGPGGCLHPLRPMGSFRDRRPGDVRQMRTPGPPDDPDLARAGQAAKPEASTEPIGETRSRRACETNELAGGAASCLWRNQATVVSGGLSTDPIGGIEVNDLFGARSREWSASWQCESEIGRCLWRVGHRRGEGERLPGKSFFWALPVCVSLRAQAFRFAPRECRRPGKAGRPPI